MKRKNDWLTVVIILLSVLLGFSVTAFAGMLLYNHFADAESITVDVAGNIITPEDDCASLTVTDSTATESVSRRMIVPAGEPGAVAVVYPDNEDPMPPAETPEEASDDGTVSVSSTKASAISLHNRNPEDNVPVQVTNMFPGDSETKYYRVKVSYKGDIVVRYHADIRSGYEKLAEAMKVKIRMPEVNRTLYDGLMRDMPESLNYALYTSESMESELYYEITAYLDTSVGNEYQNKELIADFRWWVEEVENLDPPKTGDNVGICLTVAVAAGSLTLPILLFVKRRKEAADES